MVIIPEIHTKIPNTVPIAKDIPPAYAAPTTPSSGKPKRPFTRPIKRKILMIF